MPESPILALRFPAGEVEYRSTQRDLPIGTQIRARGTLWRIREFGENGSAILELAVVPGEGTAGGSTVNPTPIGDEPMIIEVLVEA